MSITPTSPQGRSDRLIQLRAFCQAARYQSFRQAGEYVRATQSAVSRRVHALEDELGVRLFERNGPSVHLTAAGERLYRLAMPLVEGIDRLPGDFLDGERDGVSASLDITASESTAGSALAGYLKRFRERYPDVRITVRVADGATRVEWLRTYEVDLAIGALEVPPPDLEFRPILSSRPMLITPLDHPLAGRKSVTMKDTAGYPLIAHPRGSQVRTAADVIAQVHGYAGSVALEVSGWRMIKRYVQAGLGISVVPELCLDEDDRLWTYPATPYFPIRTYGLIVRRDGLLSPSARRFMRLIDPDPDSDSDAPGDTDEEPSAG